MRQILSLKRKLEEYNDLEDMKTSFEDYEVHRRQELEDDLTKLEVTSSSFKIIIILLPDYIIIIIGLYL